MMYLSKLVCIVIVLLCAASVHAKISVDGVDDYLDFTNSTNFNFSNTTFTLSGRYTASDDGYIFGKRNGVTLGTSVDGGYFLRVNADGTVTARVINQDNTNAATRSSVGTSYKDGAEHCFAIVITTNTTTLASNDVTIYMDGVLDQGSRSDSGVPYSPGTTKLVASALSDLDSAGYIAGSVEDLTIWSTGFSAENAQRYCAAKVKYLGLQLSRAAYYPLDDCTPGTSGDGRVLKDRGTLRVDGLGIDGANNTGLTCQGSTNMNYPPSTD